MKPRSVRDSDDLIKGWVLVPYATTREYGRLEIYRDKEVALMIAEIDPYFRTIMEVQIIPIKPKKRRKR